VPRRNTHQPVDCRADPAGRSDRTIAKIIKSLNRFFRQDEHGGALITVGMALPALLGVTALSVDLGLWYKSRRDYQTAADAGAISAAWQRLKGKTGLETAAKADAARNSVVVGAGITMEVNNPPKSGDYASEPEAVEVVLTVPEKTMLASMVYEGSVTNVVRAVALIEITGQACVLALNTTSASALKIWGNTNVQALNCVLGSNSNASSSINIGG